MSDDHRPLYPYHGEAYDTAMREAQLEFTQWEQSECVPRGITIYGRRNVENSDD